MNLPAIVRDHIPLEQGLRQLGMALKLVPASVRDHIPLEQGLRLLLSASILLRRSSETIFH